MGQAAWPAIFGLKFRRQFPVEGFIADFYCHERRLVIELDGVIHGQPGQVARDQNRDAYLQTLGLTILRFPTKGSFETSTEVSPLFAPEASIPVATLFLQREA